MYILYIIIITISTTEIIRYNNHRNKIMNGHEDIAAMVAILTLSLATHQVLPHPKHPCWTQVNPLAPPLALPRSS